METLQGPYKDRYNVGDIVQVATYKDKRGNLCIVMHKVLPRGWTKICTIQQVLTTGEITCLQNTYKHTKYKK